MMDESETEMALGMGRPGQEENAQLVWYTLPV